MPKRKGLRILFWVMGILVLLIIITSVVIKIVFTKEKLMTMIKPRMEAALNREVEIQDVSISIIGGLGADMEGVKIHNLPGYTHKELFEFKTLSIRVKFWPLLRKRIEIKKLILDEPIIALEKNKEGVLNIDDLIKEEGEITIPAVPFDQMEIKNGKLIFSDQTKPSQILLNQINQQARFTLDQKMENGQVLGKISISEINVEMPDLEKEISQLTFSLEHELNYNFGGDSLSINHIIISLGKASFDLKGKILSLTTSPVIDLSLSSDKIKIEELLSWIPKPEASPLSQMEGSGNMKISADLSGEFKPDTLPQFKGQVVFSDVKMKTPQLEYPFEMSYAEINFDQKALSFFTSQGKIRDAKIEMSVVIDNYEELNLAADLKSEFDLKLLQDLKKIPEQMETKGKTKIDLKAFGKLKKPEDLKLSGKVLLNDGRISVPFLAKPVEHLNADLALKQNDLKLNDISLRLGKSSVNLQGEVKEVVPYLLKKEEKVPLIRFSLNSPLLNLDEILPPQKPEPTSEKEKVKQNTLLLPGIEARGQINIQKVIFREVEQTNLIANIEISKGIVKIDNVVSKVYAGNLGGKVLCDLNDPEHITYDMEFNASKIEANDFLSRFTLFDEHLFGKLDISAKFSGRGNSIEDMKRSLLASGKVSIGDGKLVNWELLDLLGEYLQVKEMKDQKIRDLKNTFMIKNQRLYFDDFSARTNDGDWQVSGSVGFDGSMDYAVTTTLSKDLSKRFDSLGEISQFLKNEEGRVVLDIKLKGTAKSPEFTLDTSRAEKKFESQLKIKSEELKDELKEKGEELLNKFLKKKKK
ncbi:MAG: AsmA-like C-terminal region-containing protein [Candidatus Zixiibacteriota bacterium]